jgi:NAD(P)-dependent dehydrogenase (short-subunit alcohol dehydrogenase family)
VFAFNRRPGDEEPLSGVRDFIGDVRDRSAVGRFFDQAAAAGSMPDLFFLNAGINRQDHLANFDLAAFNEVMDVNLNGVLNFVGAALPLLSDGPATFVASSSSTTIFPNPNNLGYYVSKLAEARLFRLLDRRYRGRGWRFKTLILGPIATDMLSESELASKLQRFVRDMVTAKVDDAAARIARFVESSGQTLYYTRAAALVFRTAAVVGRIAPSAYRGSGPSMSRCPPAGGSPA